MSKIKALVIAAVFVLGVVLYYTFDPSESVFFPKCPFFWLTGFKCPGCGSQRAIHQLLTLHIKEAIKYNAFMVFSIPLLLFLVIADVCKEKHPRLYTISRSPLLSWTILATVLLWWVLRNILNI